ncbi:MAG: 2-hydroxyglutaryl-CoA dehydratase [Deltaproteobacteria bacterium]|nr:2-hydroxyglutaryl-CoA dehydratase [Deltaproteobacteria bacterium]
MSDHSLNSQPTAAGLDFGSRYVKLVISRSGAVVVRRRLDTLDFYRYCLHREDRRIRLDWARLGLSPAGALVVTGYGKDLLKGHLPTITEIRAHFLGARRVAGLDDFVLLEMGGQDTKALLVKGGRVFDFVTNDRCAAGTGRYLENMARFLKMPLARFAEVWAAPVEISQTCAIFGESELIGHLLRGVPLERLAAGVNASVARRAWAMVRRYPCRRLVFVGGVAKNRAVVRLLKEMSGLPVTVPPHPQFSGALGCCLEAEKILAGQGGNKDP